MSLRTGLCRSERPSDEAVGEDVERSCPGSHLAGPSARRGESDDLADGHVRELLGQAGPKIHRTCRLEQVYRPARHDS
ncbi:hypothetical protein PCANC_02950 [Puccinia coronata f. sp. avenae]|uniref:Uncharacterized protein n=1 Tax=Puccinia coronata f. sp. avenae TaxID=200324 RepID=A0A2N5T8E9_9BASI|nr:hypothetical protein PCANC_02950 [Puccinia coronata f. sp. avenae]